MQSGRFSLARCRPEDADFVADVYTEEQPDEPADAALLRHRWRTQEQNSVFGRYIVSLQAERVGVVYHGHMPWPPGMRRFGRVSARLHPAARTVVNLAALLEIAGSRERDAGAQMLAGEAREGDSTLSEAYSAGGYREDRRQRHWELDLRVEAQRLRSMAEASRRRMREARIELITLAEDRDPEVQRKLHELNEEAEADIPSTLPHVGQGFEAFRLWFEDPGIRADRFWIARRGPEILGLSVLQYPPSRGHVVTDFTGVRRSARGQGVARALKLETLLQAIDLGVPSVRTDNDSMNAPILHINAGMGYTSIPGSILYVREAGERAGE